jgi:hypothetical protein
MGPSFFFFIKLSPLQGPDSQAKVVSNMASKLPRQRKSEQKLLCGFETPEADSVRLQKYFQWFRRDNGLNGPAGTTFMVSLVLMVRGNLYDTAEAYATMFIDLCTL